MRTAPDTNATIEHNYNTAAGGGASTITLTPAGDGADRIVIDWIMWSYAAAPTSGALTVTDTTNSTTLMSIDITAAGPGQLAGPIVAPVDATVTVTLADGGATKKLSTQSRV